MTVKTIEQRWQQHSQEYLKERSEKRPLYLAMQKYGIENFSISVVEEIEDEKLLQDKERYWIEYFQSFKNGYNATISGDGKPYIDYNLVIETYSKLQNCKETARLLNIDAGWIRQILESKNIDRISSNIVNQQKYGNIIFMYDKTGKFISTFPSQKQASIYLIGSKQTSQTDIRAISGRIGEVCKGKRKTAFGYIWKYS